MEMINCFPYCCDCSTNYNSLQITLWNCVAKCNKSADSWWCTVGHQENVLWWENTQCIGYCCGFLLWWHKWNKYSSWIHLLTTLCMSNLCILHIPDICHLPLATISLSMAQFQHFEDDGGLIICYTRFGTDPCSIQQMCNLAVSPHAFFFLCCCAFSLKS